MKLSTQIKLISYLKTNAAAIAKYKQTQETMAKLRILALGNRQIENGQTAPLAEAMKRIRKQQKSL